jgi:hypothetical protein
MTRNPRAYPAALAEKDALSKQAGGTSGDCRCGTFLLYSLPGFSNYTSDLWSYGDSNPRPLACHPAATRPRVCIAAGHRPLASTPVRPRPGLLRYFRAVQVSPGRLARTWPAPYSRHLPRLPRQLPQSLALGARPPQIAQPAPASAKAAGASRKQ